MILIVILFLLKKPFLRNNPLHISQHADQSFDDALLQYEKTLQGLENTFVTAIKRKIESVMKNNNPFSVVLSIYSNYSNLLRRSKISSSLSYVISDLDRKIEKYIDSIEDGFDNNREGFLLFECRQVQGKVDRILMVS